VKPAVIGASVHSGWAAIIALSGDADAPEVVDRRRIVMIDTSFTGAKQPYHFVESMELPEAGKHLARCTALSARLASAALRQMIAELQERGFEAAAGAIVLAAGRPLPGLAGILASHALIHTAEGEFFRSILREACEALGIAVTGIRGKDLAGRAATAFGASSERIQDRIAGLGRKLGPPWTQDQKSATLAAAIVLFGLCGKTHSSNGPPSVD